MAIGARSPAGGSGSWRGRADAADITAPGIYFTLNAVDPRLLARRHNRLKQLKKDKDPTTADKDITARRLLFVEVDPDRPSGICSTDGEKAEAVAFDLKTLKVLRRIPAADDADGMVADPATGRVFVVEGDPGTITVIDPKSDRAIATIRATHSS